MDFQKWYDDNIWQNSDYDEDWDSHGACQAAWNAGKQETLKVLELNAVFFKDIKNYSKIVKEIQKL